MTYFFRSSSLSTPLWPFYKDSSLGLEFLLQHTVQNSALVIIHFSHILMSTILINYFNFRQFGVKLFGNLALIHSVVWRYKLSTMSAVYQPEEVYDVVGPVCESSDVFVFLL